MVNIFWCSLKEIYKIQIISSSTIELSKNEKRTGKMENLGIWAFLLSCHVRFKHIQSFIWRAMLRTQFVRTYFFFWFVVRTYFTTCLNDKLGLERCYFHKNQLLTCLLLYLNLICHISNCKKLSYFNFPLTTTSWFSYDNPQLPFILFYFSGGYDSFLF